MNDTPPDTVVVRILRSRVTSLGSQRAAAVALGISQSYLSDLLRGTRKAGPKILSILGLVRASRIVKVKEVIQ